MKGPRYLISALATLQGGRYRLVGGFWDSGAPPVAGRQVYLPLVST